MKTSKNRQTNPRPAPNLGLRPVSVPFRPLSLAEQRAHARWKRPVAAMLADALAVNRGLLERLKQGMHAPDTEHGEQYQVLFNGLFTTTREQIAALQVFARVDWSE